jgi:aminocarboxymuconate-semialdehyde decarboxylase
VAATQELTTVLDVHTHVFPARVPAPASPAAEAAGWPVVVDDSGRRGVFQRGSLVRTLDPVAWDPAARVRHMDAEGVTMQAVSPIPFTFLYGADAELTDQLARLQNDQIAELCAAAPGRFFGLGTVPLQDTEAAVSELRRCMLDLGLAGVEIGTWAADRQLHDAALAPFFAAAADLGAALFIHPGRALAPERTAHNGLDFALARPLETTLAAAALVQGGVLRAHPGLRVCLAHGGGCVPQMLGRWEFGHHHVRRPADPTLPSPREELAGIWADTLTYDPEALRMSALTFGVEHLVLGTDYPFAAREAPPGAAVAAAVAADLVPLGERWADRLTSNGLRFLGVEAKARDLQPVINTRTGDNP